jgi:hypothetical protein
MKKDQGTRKRTRAGRRKNSEAGVALLIAIFALLLISVVAISMIVASRTEGALNGNYKSSSSAYYASLSGLEEARGRLLPTNVNYFSNTVAGFIPAGTMLVGQVRYLTNPVNGENVLTAYPDNQYAQEFGAAPATVQTIASVSGTNSASIPGPLFKWVRINPVTEASLNFDVNQDSFIDPTTPLFYDTANLPKPSMIVPSPAGANPANVPSTAKQVLEVTAFAVLPNGTEKLTQYLVTPQTFGLSFPSALTLAGQTVVFNGANSAGYQVNGSDGSGNPGTVSGCTPGAGSVPAVGVTDASGSNANLTAVDSGIPSNRVANYTGAGLSTPSVNDSISLSSAMSSPASLNQVVQTISQNADLVVAGNATQANMPAGMSATNPMTVVVDGDFSMTGNFTGYGLLVVTGNFSYSGTTGWKGIVLVVGQGTTTFNGLGGGNNEFDGAIFAATTKNSSGQTLANFGNVGFDISGGGGNGVYYNSCWINHATQPPTYKVLSFREIPYTD